MGRFVQRSAIVGLALALGGLLCVQAVSAAEVVKKRTPSAPLKGSGSVPGSTRPAEKKATSAPRTPLAVTSNVQSLSIESFNVVPPPANSVLLQWTCRVKNNTPMVFEAPSVKVGGFQKNSQGTWILSGSTDVGKIGPAAVREYTGQFSITGNSTRFKMKIMQASTVVVESQEMDIPAVALPQVKIQSAPRTGDGWDITVKNEGSGYSPMGTTLQVIASKAGNPAVFAASGSWTVPVMAAQGTFTRHFTIYLDPSYTIYKARLIHNTNILDEMNLNL